MEKGGPINGFQISCGIPRDYTNLIPQSSEIEKCGIPHTVNSTLGEVLNKTCPQSKFRQASRIS